jgi:hypothetical protein
LQKLYAIWREPTGLWHESLIWRRKRMSNLKEWVESLQVEGDDGSGICDMCVGCPNCVEEEDNE